MLGHCHFSEIYKRHFVFNDFHDHISDIISQKSSDFNNLTLLLEFITNHVHFNVVKRDKCTDAYVSHISQCATLH